MKEHTKNFGLLSLILVFLGIPMFFYAMGDFPKRTYLKESISILTIIAFFLMLAQFFLARSANTMLKGYKFYTILKIHKAIGYVFISVLLVHPLLIVVPRYFESGVDSKDAFLIIITSFNSLGVVLGIISWFLLLGLIVTSLLRFRLPLTYKTWRIVHGILSILFISTASWHAINLGRHTDTLLSSYIIALLLGSVLVLLKSHKVKSPSTANIMK